MKRLIFGGTFNPVHDGHVQLCRFLASEIHADCIMIVPAYQPVHKQMSKDFAKPEQRMDMCALAFADIHNCEICNWEI